jgi:hypothetical protein
MSSCGSLRFSGLRSPLLHESERLARELVALASVASVGSPRCGKWLGLRSRSDGGLVDPFPRHGQGEYIDSCPVLFDDDVSVVSFAPSGHRRIDTGKVGGSVGQEESGIDGASLGGMACLGISEAQLLGGVTGRESDCPRAAHESDRTVAMDGLDGPVVAVLDHDTSVSAEISVIAASDHLITDTNDLVADPEPPLLD